MTKNKKTAVLLVLTAIFISTAAIAATKPSVPSGVPWSLGNQSSSMPSPRFAQATSNPYPTNKWYGSVYINSSQKMAPAPFISKYDASGYYLGFPNVIQWGNDFLVYEDNSLALSVKGVNSSNGVISWGNPSLKSDSDWSFTGVITDSVDTANKMTTTFGKGFIFTYNYFTPGVNPRIEAKNNILTTMTFTYYDSAGNTLSAGSSFTGDSIMIGLKAHDLFNYYAIYAPSGTTFTLTSNTQLNISFASSVETERYLSIGAVMVNSTDNQTEAKRIFNDYYNYAYNFITDTKVIWEKGSSDSSVSTTFNFTFDAKRSGGTFVNGQTVFALYPHQHKNLAPDSSHFSIETQTYKTIRGTMKTLKGGSFKVKNMFHGILPNLTYEIPQSDSKITAYINYDANFNLQTDGAFNSNNTYRRGKVLARAANLIPILHQYGDTAKRNSMIVKVKTELERWYRGAAGTYFGYDSVWGGIIGIPYGDIYWTPHYNDHHFHYGYYVYASAILALFDAEFASSANYRGIVELLIEDYANPDRANRSFPFLRNFDIYEGHSWANGGAGFGGDGNDQESSSEAMNSWAGIYLWGIATNNQDWIDLGMYGYTTESSAVREYYFDVDNTTYETLYIGGGILYEHKTAHGVHWSTNASQEIMGIWLLPLNPSMLYLGYEVEKGRQQNYFSQYNTTKTAEAPDRWRDVWLKYESLFNAPQALADWNVFNPNPSTYDVSDGKGNDGGSSLTSSYHFINFFNQYGTVNMNYYADSPEFCVMTKGGQNTFIAFNPSTSSYKNVSFSPAAGTMTVPPMTFVTTKDFADFKYDSLRTMYSSSNSYVLLMDVYSDSVTVSGVSAPAINTTYYETFPFAFTINKPSGNLNNMKTYVRLPDVPINSTSAVRLAVYNSGTSLPDRPFPSQNVTLESASGGVATVIIETTLSSTGTYVLVVPKGVQPPGNILISGNITNAKDGSAVSGTINLYNTVYNSTVTQSFNGSYSFDVVAGVSYVLSPSADGFLFEPESYSFTAGSDLTKDFAALPKYELSGTVTFGGRGMGKIKINVYDTVSGSTQTVTTASDGKFTADMYYGRSYRATPASDEYDFSSEYMYFNNVQSSFYYADFIAQIVAGRFVAYPNPYKPSKYGHVGITFAGLKAGAEIRIYNIAGELVFDKKAQSDGPYVWYAENNSGYQAASGVYIYYIKSGGKTHKGKVAVER